MRGRYRLLADITPLRQSAAFRRMWAGATLSAVGSALTSFAVMLQVYDLTRSPVAVGAIGVAQAVPTLAIGLLAGPVTDATDRRRLVLATSTCLAALSAALAAQAFAGLGVVWLLYALVAAQSALGAVDRPARSTFVPGLLRQPAARQDSPESAELPDRADGRPGASRTHRGCAAPGAARVLSHPYGQLYCLAIRGGPLPQCRHKAMPHPRLRALPQG